VGWEGECGKRVEGGEWGGRMGENEGRGRGEKGGGARARGGGGQCVCVCVCVCVLCEHVVTLDRLKVWCGDGWRVRVYVPGLLPPINHQACTPIGLGGTCGSLLQ
jgi:hypothetical protein